MKQIPLTRGYIALVDDSDYATLSRYHWHARVSTKTKSVYPVATVNRRQIKMHHLLLNKKDGFEIDHIDKDQLNNQRNNLRYATKSQNAVNQRIRHNCSSGVTGVYFYPKTSNWKAQITVDKRRIHLGTFSSKSQAIKTRRDAEQRYFPGVIINHTRKTSSVRQSSIKQHFYRQKLPKSGYRCVYINRQGKFYPVFHEGNKLIYLGLHETALEAAKTYIKYFRNKFGKSPYKLK